MKTMLALALAAALATDAHADLPFQPDDWTATDTHRQVAITAIHVLDAMQTAQIQNHDDIVEANPLTRAVLGENPGTAATWGYFAGVIVADYAIAAVLPKKYRRVYQYIDIAFNGATVANNLRLGLKFKF